MRKVLFVLGYLIFLVAGVILLYYQIAYAYDFWGTLGVILAIVGAPFAVFFPFVFWWLESDFPSFFFLVWAILDP